MTITIKTALAEGIYKSAGGGQITTYYEWATGPRNLLNAVKVLGQHSAEMTQGFGNIGHCGSWIEVDGVRVKDCDLTELDPGWVREARRECPGMRIKSATESAAWLIENIKSIAAATQRLAELAREASGYEESTDEEWLGEFWSNATRDDHNNTLRGFGYDEFQIAVRAARTAA